MPTRLPHLRQIRNLLVIVNPPLDCHRDGWRWSMLPADNGDGVCDRRCSRRRRRCRRRADSRRLRSGSVGLRRGLAQVFFGAAVNGLHGGARYLHIRAAFFLGKILEIDEPKRFKFIDGQHDGSCAVVSADRKKFLRVRELTNLPAFLWSSHMIHLRSLCAGHRFGFSIVELGVSVNCNGLPLPKLSKMGYHFSITIDRRE